jgi:Ser/Thr protein kinase RdoA (MazF antagonist)
MSRFDRALAAWGRPVIVGRLGGGNRNAVVEIRLGRERLAARRSSRRPASLEWEAALLEHLAGHGLRVPIPVPALDGRRHVDGVTVQTWLSGRQPEPRDWPAVAATLSMVHQLTTEWAQRPGFASTSELLTADRGGDVDLSKMPAEAVTACRLAWARLAGRPRAVVHGDPGPANIRVTRDGVGLLDWDESRVDCTDLDFADLPGAHLPPESLNIARTAVRAWEAASGWTAEPSYARQQLALLQAAQR